MPKKRKASTLDDQDRSGEKHPAQTNPGASKSVTTVLKSARNPDSRGHAVKRSVGDDNGSRSAGAIQTKSHTAGWGRWILGAVG